MESLQLLSMATSIRACRIPDAAAVHDAFWQEFFVPRGSTGST